MPRVLAVALLTALAFVSSVAGQTAPPTPEEYLGYARGERFTPHHRIVGYFEELARRSNLVTVRQIGESYEHRPLHLATITSAKNHERIDAIRSSVGAIARGDGDAKQIAADLPAIVWLAFGIHGNESSSAEAAMFVASALLRDPSLTPLLDQVVVVIDPLQNPDGRERYTEWYRRTRGARPNPNSEAMEHAEPWPGGRFNHYLIDMNRDWAWASQKETQARVAAYRGWNPQVFVDFHEMGHESSYFFPPSAKPLNANLPQETARWLEAFGQANAGAFSSKGLSFFVGEHFDLFYPAYGDAWPSLRGAVGMTYEMAGGGRAGLAVEREDGSVLTLADRIDRHALAAITTIRTTAANREALLRHTHAAARMQLEAPAKTFLISMEAPNAEALIATLQRQGILVEMLTAAASLRATNIERNLPETRTFPAGTAVVTTRQPLGGLATTLLERNAKIDPAFVEKQRSRSEADEPDQFYDVTAWSLPLAMNVDAWITTAPVTARGELTIARAAGFARASYGYLVDALDPAIYRLAGELLEREIRFSVAQEEISFAGRQFRRGSLVILRNNNAVDLDSELASAVADSGARLTGVESGWTGGTALGSSTISFVAPPSIALVGGAGTDPTSFGMLWHTLDIDTPIPHSVLSLDSLRNTDLGSYDVLVLPSGNYSDRISSSTAEKLKQWVNAGGTVVAVGGASTWLRNKDVGLSKLSTRDEPADDDEKGVKVENDEGSGEKRYNPYSVPGAAFRSVINDRSWLTFGVPKAPPMLVGGSTAFKPLAHRVDNIVTLAREDALISGVAWPESIEALKGAVQVAAEPVGRGQVITFAEEPNFRLFWRGTLPIFLNSVLYSKTFSR